ncbi:P-loop NTPase [Endozoicomonas gorgoniicola]|uniref:P-loop NTPase n=1 Tax=Endozoicomonas gorgoniicola TaxID=1234144 RepID=A0ABT3MXQ0_9GAMM|nr:P-loop NTPase [Endozoicomonas gorgoniicola]MCW7554168.1 P-loop NTPase [Endozoicomonas gorgoniicola]
MNSSTKQVIAVAGCKGGVGKTLISVNLALALAKKGRKVVLVDGNLDVPDVGVTLGLEKDLDMNAPETSRIEAYGHGLLRQGPSGVNVLTPGGKPIWRESINVSHAVEMIDSLEPLAPSLDTLILDTSPGLAPDNITLIQAAGEILIVVNQEVVSLLDALRLIRVLYRIYGVQKFGIIVNAVSNRRSGAQQFEKLQAQLKDEVEIVLRFLGTIPFDKTVAESLKEQKALLEHNPDCRASKAILRIAHQLHSMPVTPPRGRIEFFLPTRIKERV